VAFQERRTKSHGVPRTMLPSSPKSSSHESHNWSHDPDLLRHDEGKARSNKAKPIDRKFWADNRFPAKEHCSLCGLCETSHYVQEVKRACPFLGEAMSRIDHLEPTVHGRRRRQVGDDSSGSDDQHLVWDDALPARAESFDEGRFGVLSQPVMLAKGVSMTPEAQWTGVVTSIAVSLLEQGVVDAVICVAAAATTSADDNTGSWIQAPEPILARTPEDVLRGRGVKPVLAPCLSLLDEVDADPTITSLLFCGVGCAVQALRSVQPQLKLKKLLVLGTNCADNSPTAQAADRFVREGVLGGTGGNDAQSHGESSTAIRGYEFMPDFRVHVKSGTSYVTKPYFSLPASMASKSIAKSCLACSDYTNALADVVVGYMGAPYDPTAENRRNDGQEADLRTKPSAGRGPRRMDQCWQTLTVRNDRGARMVDIAVNAGRLQTQPFAQYFNQSSDSKTGILDGAFLNQNPASSPRRRHKFERLVVSTVEADAIVQEMIGQPVPDSGLPEWLGNIIASALTEWIAPTDVSFARYSIDYHLVRNYLHMVYTWGTVRATQSIPQSAMRIVSHYRSNYPAIRRLVEQVERIHAQQQKKVS
jgi:coenzyme F420-reducing hydrogenase beta subunit